MKYEETLAKTSELISKWHKENLTINTYTDEELYSKLRESPQIPHEKGIVDEIKMAEISLLCMKSTNSPLKPSVALEFTPKNPKFRNGNTLPNSISPVKRNRRTNSTHLTPYYSQCEHFNIKAEKPIPPLKYFTRKAENSPHIGKPGSLSPTKKNTKQPFKIVNGTKTFACMNLPFAGKEIARKGISNGNAPKKSNHRKKCSLAASIEGKIVSFSSM
eukprot:TRINITY_DN10146_c0_g1_i13.p1 TRINITY_DN10146_c0_g1~~TRINITY_DN10146_c0_g1_i13.p1  ORF type:complete len:217 (-),score=29.99 TRINITY_DN10146_c0_g1_i13:271-921(-)